MRFTDSDFIFVPDGVGGQYLEGTFELTVLEATGIALIGEKITKAARARKRVQR